MCQEDLAQVLRHLPKIENENVIFGFDTVGDAGVYRLSEDTALVQTVDVLTPIADAPYTFGQIAAANSLSDIYAMGAKPVTALNIVGFPANLDIKYLGEIIQGGMAVAKKAGVALLGGHTIKDQELKYGMAVTGIVHPKKLITNQNAQPGDRLILTKPVGTGIISTALKREKASQTAVEAINRGMTTLNRAAAECMVEFDTHACTDITGFGLLGHAAQMAEANAVSLEIYASKVPLYPEAFEYAKMNLIPGGTKTNEKFIRPKISVNPEIDDVLYMLLCDAQTSGGLLISVAPEAAEKLLKNLHDRGVLEARIIGEVILQQEKVIYVVN